MEFATKFYLSYIYSSSTRSKIKLVQKNVMPTVSVSLNLFKSLLCFQKPRPGVACSDVTSAVPFVAAAADVKRSVTIRCTFNTSIGEITSTGVCTLDRQFHRQSVHETDSRHFGLNGLTGEAFRVLCTSERSHKAHRLADTL